jgi:hypothetical protein
LIFSSAKFEGSELCPSAQSRQFPCRPRIACDVESAA